MTKQQRPSALRKKNRRWSKLEKTVDTLGVDESAVIPSAETAKEATVIGRVDQHGAETTCQRYLAVPPKEVDQYLPVDIQKRVSDIKKDLIHILVEEGMPLSVFSLDRKQTDKRVIQSLLERKSSVRFSQCATYGDMIRARIGDSNWRVVVLLSAKTTSQDDHDGTIVTRQAVVLSVYQSKHTTCNHGYDTLRTLVKEMRFVPNVE